MDNASRAIIIAAGFFIGVALISVFMYTLTSFREFQETSNQMVIDREKDQFNSNFIPILKDDVIKGYQIYNLLGLAIDLNSKNDANYYIKINGSEDIDSLKEIRKEFYFTENLDKNYTIQDVQYSDGVISNIVIPDVKNGSEKIAIGDLP